MSLVTVTRERSGVHGVEGDSGNDWGPRSLGFNAVIAPIDVLVPPLFRRTNAAVRGEGEVACVRYADPTMPPLSAADSPLRAGESSVTMQPAIRTHAADGSVSFGDFASSDEYRFSYKLEDQQSVKQGLLEVLLGVTDGSVGDFGTGRPLPPPTVAEEVSMRLHGTHCDATYVASPPLLLRLIELILRSRTDPARLMVGCVTSIDLSHTDLGIVGAAGPPLRFDGVGNDGAAGPWAATEQFFPDQPRPWSECTASVRNRLAARSLSLCYVCPLLFVPGAQNYSVTQLTCAYCQLSDADAEALAAVLRHRAGGSFQCLLEAVDLSFNNITDAGATALLRALRKNRTLATLLLAGNAEVTERRTLDAIQRRLDANQRRKSKRRSWFMRLFSR